MTSDLSPWVLADEPVSLGHTYGIVTLVDGQTFCVSRSDGDIDPQSAHGLFFADLRVLSSLKLTIEGVPLEPLAVAVEGSYAATHVLRTREPFSPSGQRMIVVRRRALGGVMSEHIELRNYGTADQPATLTLRLGADFSDLFAVKEGRHVSIGERTVETRSSSIVSKWSFNGVHRQVTFDCEGAEVGRDGARWQVVVPSKGCVECFWQVRVTSDNEWLPPAHRSTSSRERARVRNEAWIHSAPTLRTSHTGLSLTFAKSVADLGGLRLFDPSGVRPAVVAAGAPWFMTLFGRDALLTAYMALPVDPTLALGVLQALAELQGTKYDAATEEEPGRILHEIRFLQSPSFDLAAGHAYFGSIDATPLFVVLLGELSRWGLPEPTLRSLLPAADRALQWIASRRERYGGRYLAYRRETPHGLANQGWKDSWDGIRYHDGRVAEAPLATCEVQGYMYAAFVARAEIAQRLGHAEEAVARWAEAAELKSAFNRDYWIEELGWLATALGPDGEHVDALTSNIGHCLWTGIVDDALAGPVADALVSAPMWSGWGLRTMASDEPAYDPTSYHCGSVWPHDNALCAAGLARYGRFDDAHRIILGLLDAATSWGGRMPELFCGIERGDISTPVPYPTSCSPQAWAAASPLLFTRLMLGLEPNLAQGRCSLANRLPASIDRLAVKGLRLWDQSFSVDAANGVIRAAGLADGVAEGVAPAE